MRRIVQKFGGNRSRRAAKAVWARAVIALIVGAQAVEAATSKLDQALAAYDAAITADSTPALTKSTIAVTLDGTAGSPFDFGATSGDGTMEFILTGDPTAGPDGYL